MNKIQKFALGFLIPIAQLMALSLAVLVVVFWVALLVSFAAALYYYPILTVSLTIFIVCIYKGFEQMQRNDLDG